jgi:hypothetical protein
MIVDPCSCVLIRDPIEPFRELVRLKQGDRGIRRDTKLDYLVFDLNPDCAGNVGLLGFFGLAISVS